ncbi:MAG TPA: response regulator [Polyangia bacterium]
MSRAPSVQEVHDRRHRENALRIGCPAQKRFTDNRIDPMNGLSPHPAESRGTILVVEDDHDIRVSVRALLEDEGYTVLTVTNGLAALSALERATALPQLILLDLMLPIMDGWHFVERVRLNPRFTKIPFAIVSAYEEPPAPEGAVAFVKKPFDADALLRLVSAHCD